MRVIRVSRFGDPDVLVPDVADEPVAGPGQVVVAVAVAAIDFVQTQLRRGVTPGPPLPDLPYVPGRSVAGTVRSVGPGVAADLVGRRVVTHTASGWDGYAEQAVAAADAVIEIPPELGAHEAAALLDDGATALGLVETAQVRAGEWVLVEAAAGGVGSLVVQLARAAGARVVGAARGAAKLDLARKVGAEVAVDYTEPDWTARVLDATGRGPDLVFDGVGGRIGRQAFDVTAPGGRFFRHGAASGSPTAIAAGERDVHVLGFEQLLALRGGAEERARRMLADAAAGRIGPVIGRTFPLEQAAAAHAAMQAREVLGKTLLVV